MTKCQCLGQVIDAAKEGKWVLSSVCRFGFMIKTLQPFQPAASDQSGRAMIPTCTAVVAWTFSYIYIFWLASLVVTIQMLYIYSIIQLSTHRHVLSFTATGAAPSRQTWYISVHKFLSWGRDLRLVERLQQPRAGCEHSPFSNSPGSSQTVCPFKRA